jgi:hypothetical protein
MPPERDGHVNISRGNFQKLTAVLVSIETLLGKMAPVHTAVARIIRMDAEAVFIASVDHRTICNHEECHKTIFDKPADMIASKSFAFTVQKLGRRGVDGVSKMDIQLLNDRVQRSPIFNPPRNATKHQSCLAMIRALSRDDNSRKCPRLSSDCSSAHGADTRMNRLPLERQESGLASSPAVQVRDEIRRIGLLYEYSPMTLQKATSALQNAHMFSLLFDNASDLHSLDYSSKAYLVLLSIVESMGVEKQNVCKMRQDHDQLLQAARIQNAMERVSEVWALYVRQQVKRGGGEEEEDRFYE